MALMSYSHSQLFCRTVLILDLPDHMFFHDWVGLRVFGMKVHRRCFVPRHLPH